MRFRIFGVTIAWFIVMSVVLLDIFFPSLTSSIDFSAKYSFQYAFFYFLMSFNLCSSFKRQQKNELLKRRAVPYSVIVTFFILLMLELIAMYIYPERNFQWFWILMGIIGIYLGMLTFRLLYKECY